LLAQRRAAIAAFQQAEADYRQTVLQAFQNVADVLRALETDARTLQAQVRAEDAARRALKLTMDQYRLGGASYINLLNAQQQYQQTRISRIQAQAIRYSDTAALFQALGGGWWHKPWCVKECV
jgi:outer membrane protein TolC